MVATIRSFNSNTAWCNLTSPYGLTIDSLGFLYVSDSHCQGAFRFSNIGTFTQYYDMRGGIYGLQSPWGIAVDSTFSLWGTAGYSGVLKMFPNGLDWINYPTPTFFGMFASNVAVDSTGAVYSADGVDFTAFWKWTANTVTNGGWTEVSYTAGPSGVLVDWQDNVFLADALEGIRQFSPDGYLLQTIPLSGASYVGLTLDNSGSLYMADTKNNLTWIFPSVTPPIPVGCGPTTLHGPFVINAAKNMASPMQQLFSDAANTYNDVLARGLILYPGGGSLTFYSAVDNSTSAWCFDGSTCTEPQGRGPLSAYGSPASGWPSVTGFYPVNSLAYRVAASVATNLASLTEYAPVFSSATLNRTIALPTTFQGPQHLWLADLSWNWSGYANAGVVQVMVQYTPSAQACAQLASSSSSTATPASSTAGISSPRSSSQVSSSISSSAGPTSPSHFTSSLSVSSAPAPVATALFRQFVHPDVLTARHRTFSVVSCVFVAGAVQCHECLCEWSHRRRSSQWQRKSSLHHQVRGFFFHPCHPVPLHLFSVAIGSSALPQLPSASRQCWPQLQSVFTSTAAWCRPHSIAVSTPPVLVIWWGG